MEPLEEPREEAPVVLEEPADIWDAEPQVEDRQESSHELPIEAVEVNYVDPNSKEACTVEVFYDAEAWSRKRNRFFVSAELINILSDAHEMRRSRFKALIEKLQAARFGYLCDLHRLREKIGNLRARAAQLEEETLSLTFQPGALGFEFAELTGEVTSIAPGGQGERAGVPEGWYVRMVGESKFAPSAFTRYLEGGMAFLMSFAKTPGDAKADTSEEICPVHFFKPNHYIDQWSIDGVNRAAQSFVAEAEATIKAANEKIVMLSGGGSGWDSLMQHFIQSGEMTIEELVTGIKESIDDDVEIRYIDNRLTGGVRDKMDALRLILDKMEAEFADYTRRSAAIESSFVLASGDNAKYKERLAEIKMQMVERVEAAENEEDEEDDDPVKAAEIARIERERIEEKRKDLFLQTEFQKSQVDQRLERVRQAIATQEAKKKQAEAEAEEVKKLEAKTKALQMKNRVVRKRAVKVIESANQIGEQTRSMEEKIASEQEIVETTRGKLGNMPPPSPQGTKLAFLRRAINKAADEEGEIQRKMDKPMARIKAIRRQTVTMYKKLGWEQDFSDSDDDEDSADENMAYWKRRKTAMNGLARFDPTLFNYSETSRKQTRMLRRLEQDKKEKEELFLQQMLAKGQGREARDVNLEVAAVDVMPWVNDVVEEEQDAPKRGRRVRPRKDAVASRDLNVEEPANGGDAAKELWASFGAELRRCATSLVGLLPPVSDAGSTAVLRDLRSRAEALAEGSPEAQPAGEPAMWDIEDVRQRAESLVSSLCNIVAAAATSGAGGLVTCRTRGAEEAVAAAVQHAAEAGELRKCLDRLHASQSQLNLLLRTHPGTGASAAKSRELRLPFNGAGSYSSDGEGQSPTDSFWGGGGDSPLGSGPPSPHRRSPHHSPSPPFQRNGRTGSGRMNRSGPELRLIGSKNVHSRQRRRRQASTSKGEMDFGFRADGVGEESLENWPLFKVSKSVAPGTAAGEQVGNISGGGSCGPGDPGSRPPGRSKDLMRSLDAKIALHQRAAADWDFHAYVRRPRQSGESISQEASRSMRSASTPELSIASGRDKWLSLPNIFQKNAQVVGPAAAVHNPTWAASKQRRDGVVLKDHPLRGGRF